MNTINVINKGEKKAQILIGGTIGYDWWAGDPDKNTKERMRNELKAISEIKATEIEIEINSLGGDVNHALSIYDMLGQMKAKKTVIITGFTASAATLISMVGDTIKMSENAFYLIHRASTFAMGNSTDIEAVVKDLETIDNKLISLYKKKADPDKVDALMDSDGGHGEWLTAEQALEYGFIDEVVDMKIQNIAASYDENVFNHIPKMPENNKKSILNIMNAEQIMTEIKAMKANITALLDKFNNKEEKLNKEEINNEITQFSDKYEALENELTTLENSLTEKDNEITNLQNEVERLKGTATKTDPVEDPNIDDDEDERSVNEKQAEEDFKALMANY